MRRQQHGNLLFLLQLESVCLGDMLQGLPIYPMCLRRWVEEDVSELRGRVFLMLWAGEKKPVIPDKFRDPSITKGQTLGGVWSHIPIASPSFWNQLTCWHG